MRHEWLSIDNHLGGSGGEAMATLAELADLQGCPARSVAGVWLQSLPSLRLHAAVQRNYDGAKAVLSIILGVQYRYDIVLPK